VAKIRKLCALAACMLLCAFGAAIPVQGQNPPPDETLYTSYYFDSADQNVTWIVCGATSETEGCYGSGKLGPFGKIGAMIESNPLVSGNVVTRAIYLVDISSGGGSGVELYVYKKVDTVSSLGDTITVTLWKTTSLPLTGGSTASASMGANNRFLFIGTDQSPQAVRVTKADLSYIQLGEFSPPINVTSITADQYGYVTVTFGGSSADSAISQYGPNGEEVADGGGAEYMLNTVTALLPATLPASDSAPDKQLGYRLKAAP
jgi:hypothetical protein